ncbi:MAG: hypothetical protein AB8G77_25475 [Rhodothermales bacterium]
MLTLPQNMSSILSFGRPDLKFLAYLSFLLLFLPYQSSFAQVNETEDFDHCNEIVSNAEDQFFNAEFKQAIDALKSCTAAPALLDAEKAEIYLLLARVYFADQQKAPAAEALGHLFSLKPDFEPQSFLPPPFIEYAAQIREIQTDEEVLDKHLVPPPTISEEKQTNGKRWLLIGGSGLFAVTAVAIMSSGRSSTANAFPPAPGPPAGQ